MAADAQRAAGARPTAEPFTRTRRRRVPAPPLRAGVACDISGSMKAFTGPVASVGWILARAAGALPAATTATVLYEEQVHALTHPGQAPARVADFTPPLDSETGRELAGLALKARVQQLQRLQEARADSLPFLGEKRRSHRLGC